MTTNTIAHRFNARSLLFVPGDRPERFEKAIASGTDCICIDLEDAVAAERKQLARDEVLQFLQRQAVIPLVCVRINALNTADGLRDLLALLEVAPPYAVLLPKTESAEQLQLASKVASGLRWIALVESAQGLWRAEDIALRSPNLAAMMFGGADFSADIGASFCWESLLHARQRLVCAAALRHLPLIDVPYLDINDEEGLREETKKVAAIGFSCKSAIHPRQVKEIHRALCPPATEIANAKRILDGAAASGGGVFVIDGMMVDGPVIANAQRLLMRGEGVATQAIP
jgi:(S)-citramalyl-CoA lyase